MVVLVYDLECNNLDYISKTQEYLLSFQFLEWHYPQPPTRWKEGDRNRQRKIWAQLEMIR
jgi:hypothetical protein